MKAAQLPNTQTTTTPRCRWAWPQHCQGAPTSYSEVLPPPSPSPLPPFFKKIPFSVKVLPAGSALGDPRGENTLLSPGSQGDCWRIPVYDFAAAAAAAVGERRKQAQCQASVADGGSDKREKSAEKTCFFSSKTILGIPKTAQQATKLLFFWTFLFLEIWP